MAHYFFFEEKWLTTVNIVHISKKKTNKTEANEFPMGSPVHVTPTCARSVEGSDNFGSYVVPWNCRKYCMWSSASIIDTLVSKSMQFHETEEH
jgi:hypothetical protein